MAMFSDGQLTAVLGVVVTGTGGGIAFLKWAWGQYLAYKENAETKAADERRENNDRWLSVVNRSNDFQMEFMKGFTRLEGKMDWVLRETSGVHSVPDILEAAKKDREKQDRDRANREERNTPIEGVPYIPGGPGGYHQGRKKTAQEE